MKGKIGAMFFLNGNEEVKENASSGIDIESQKSKERAITATQTINYLSTFAHNRKLSLSKLRF